MAEERTFRTLRGYRDQDRDKNKLSGSMEDYLEMIYRYCEQDEFIRMSALAKRLNVKASSANKMVQKLAQLDLIYYEKYGVIQMTLKGKKMGKFLLKRHEIIEQFLNIIGVEDMILTDTERMEHNISHNTLEKIQLLNHFLKTHTDVYQQYQDYIKKRMKEKEEVE